MNKTERGNINREIVRRNMMLEQAKAMLELAKQEVQSIQYALYEPYRTTYKESQSLKGLAKMKFDREHKESLAKYPEMRERLQNLLEQGERITPKRLCRGNQLQQEES